MRKRGGGIVIPPSKFYDFNDCVIGTGLLDLFSSGLFFTWSNLQKYDPIRSKLDRVFYNSSWLQEFPHFYYKVMRPQSSGHSPLIVHMNPNTISLSRFIFRNYWVSYPQFKEVIPSSQNLFVHGDPIFVFSKKLLKVKQGLRLYVWDSISLASQLSTFKHEQMLTLLKLEKDPNNPSYLENFLDINARYKYVTIKESLQVK